MNIFNYFELSSLFLLYLLLIGRTLQLMAKGIKPFVLGKGKKGFDAVLEILFIIGLLIWSFEIISYSLQLKWHVFPEIIYIQLFNIALLKAVGVILTSAGFILFILSLISFGNSWRIGIDKKNPGKLATTGVFSITRNPIFVFIDLYFFGTWLIYSNLFFLLFSIIVTLGIHYQILEEEKFLTVQFGRDYLNYMKKVRRYI